jgi:hypothetical protein
MAKAPHGATRRRRPPVDPDYDPRVGPLPDDDEDMPPAEAQTAEDPVQKFLREQLKEQAEETVEQLRAMHAEVRTPDGRLRRAKFIGAVLGLRFERFTPVEIAAILKVKRSSVMRALQLVRKDASIAEQLKRMDEQIVPIAIDNVHAAVIHGDMRSSMKLLDGRGLFRTHKSIEAQISEQRVDIRILVTRPSHMDPAAPLPDVKPGAIAAGRPSGRRLPDIDTKGKAV